MCIFPCGRILFWRRWYVDIFRGQQPGQQIQEILWDIHNKNSGSWRIRSLSLVSGHGEPWGPWDWDWTAFLFKVTGCSFSARTNDRLSRRIVELIWGRCLDMMLGSIGLVADLWIWWICRDVSLQDWFARWGSTGCIYIYHDYHVRFSYCILYNITRS